MHKQIMYVAILGSIARRPGSGTKSKITPEILEVVEAKMLLDDESSAYQLHALLRSKGHLLSVRTVLRCRQVLGWTFR